jgi:hypothetical protein
MTAPKRRWFRFSLRTMFVVVTALCIWLVVHEKWVKDRARVLRWLDQFPAASGEPPMYYVADDIHHKPAPLSLLVLGDRTIRIVHVPFGDDASLEIAELRVRDARRLFPEAEVRLLHRPGPCLVGNAGSLWELIERPAEP